MSASSTFLRLLCKHYTTVLSYAQMFITTNHLMLLVNVYILITIDIGWKAKLSQLNPDEYEGYGCTVCDVETWFHVNVHQGRIDVLRNLVIHETTDAFIPTQIKHVRMTRRFYI